MQRGSNESNTPVTQTMLKITPQRGLWRILATFLAISVTLPVQATPAMEKLFYVLKSKGSLTQDEYDMLIAAMRADEKVASPKSSPSESAPATGNIATRLAKTESKLESLENVITNTRGQVEDISKITDNTSPATMSKADLDVLLADKWYERLKLKGYMQFRGSSVLNENGGLLNVPNDPFANDVTTLGIRRGRLTLSGDITSHLYMYVQVDYFGTVTGSASGTGTNVNALQARDYYADISLDPGREYRVRLGLSKVPFGWSNMQSSQNRLATERPDAINSAVEGERDLGAFFYYSPYDVRERFKNLVKMGLRGSGDYGLLALGAYSGQGIGRSDGNAQTHFVARLAYPFEFSNGQFFEVGIAAYTGRFMPAVTGATAVPTRGVNDSRVGISAILYPQPFGLEAEWNWGEGPELNTATNRIDAKSLNGGYIQACYRHVFANSQELIPFVRWQYYNGGRKFAANAPHNNVNEVGLGLRYIPYPELEMSLMFNHGTRTNTNLAPYNAVSYEYIGLQAQVNF